MILDTSVIIHASHGSKRDLTAIAGLPDVFIPQAAVGEFLAGVQEVDHPRARDAVEWFWEVLDDATVLSPTLATSRLYARIEQHGRRAGRPIPHNDL